jgi:hypothetical protein
MTQKLRPGPQVLATVLALLATAALAGCRTDRANPSGPAPSATSASSVQAALPGALDASIVGTARAAPPATTAPADPDAGPPQLDAGDPPGASAAGPQVTPVLDKARGARALAAYRALLTRSCRAVDGGSAAGTLDRSGLRVEGAYVDTVCSDARSAGTAFASGSFVKAGADEVLLVVPTGLSAASGDNALALMRSDDTGYRFVKHMVLGKGFSAKIRLTTTAGRDILLLCQQHGNMGLYPSTCGFFGRGTFRDRTANAAPGNAGKNELDLGFVTTCGPGASIDLGEITLHDDILRVELIVEHFVLQKDPTDSPGDFCSRRVRRSRKQLDVEYRFDGASFERTTPALEEVQEVRSKYGY